MMRRSAVGMLAIVIAELLVGCSDFHAKEQHGGETHFLMKCGEDENACEDGLECVCGVCTKACVGGAGCSELGEDVACEDVVAGSLLCEGAPPAARICDQGCAEDSDCDSRGTGLECVEGRCRPEEVAAQIAMRESDAAVPEGGIDPLLFIVLDTSGSMERLAECTCTTSGCEECLPDCSSSRPEKNRWTQALEALTGTYVTFSCIARDRDQDGFTYDRSYPLPYHEPLGTQADDGVLDMFADEVRFGIATFDVVATYDRDQQRMPAEFDFMLSQTEPGLWSYPESNSLLPRPDGSLRGAYRYPGHPSDYWMDSGIRSAKAREGALLAAIDPSDAQTVASDIQSDLLRTRPYGGTPIAAALDDLYWYFASDPATASERADLQRKQHVVLITDGRPDDDYRNVNCDCNEPEAGKNCADHLPPGAEATEIFCPYPRPERAARNLRCGYFEDCDQGVVRDVHVIGLAISDDDVAQRNVQDIAEQGGTEAMFATSGAELRDALSRIIDEITSEPEPSSDGANCMNVVGTDLTYAHGATWQRACNDCECSDGRVNCTRVACAACYSAEDCAEGEICHFGYHASCGRGECGPPPANDCDAPLDTEGGCTCGGSVVDDIDCAAIAAGVELPGDCD